MLWWKPLFVAVIASIATSSRGQAPPPSREAVQLVEKIAEAARAGLPSVSVAAARYVFSDLPLRVVAARDLVINVEAGTEFAFFFGTGGVQFVHCSNVTVRGNGLAVDSLGPNFAQGKVLRWEATKPPFSVFVGQFDQDFLAPDSAHDPFSRPGAPHGAHVVFWDPKSRTMLPGLSSMSMNSSTLVGPGKWRVVLEERPHTPVKADSLVTVFARRGFVWNSLNCSDMTYENVNLYAGGNEGFTEAFGDGGNVYRSVRIGRRPNSSNLLSINADGFNVDSVGRGPTIVDSEVGFNGDDLFSVHNRLQVVCQVTSSSEVVVMDLGQGPVMEWDKYGSVLPALRPADIVLFRHLSPGRTANGTRIGSGIVRAAQNASADPAVVGACKRALGTMSTKYQIAVVEPFAGATLYRVQFAESLPAEMLTVPVAIMTVPRRSSANAVIRNSHFHDGAQRMGIIGASGMLVDGNTFARTLNTGLHVENEQWALEGDLDLANITISNNVIVTQGSNAPTIDVLSGSANVTCRNNVWQHGGKNRSLDGCHIVPA
jgi:hypothetical protein